MTQELTQEPILFTVKEAGQMLSLSPATLYKYVSTGELACVRIGKALRFTRQQLEDFVQLMEKKDF